jgi:curved DNA-binding protein CbpA
MAQCECGRPIGASGKSCARCDALRTLGLERGASRNEIRDTYLDLVKVWHPDRFSYDAKLRSRAEEKLKEVNAAFQHLNSSAGRTPARAASATKKPYWTSRTATRTYQWYATSARETPRPNASAPEPPLKDVSQSGFPNAARPQSKVNARTQSPTREASRPINAAFQHLNSSADTTPARAASATKKPEARAEARKLFENSGTSTRTFQGSPAFATETPRSNASAQEPPRKAVSRMSFLNAADPQPNGNARAQSPVPKAYHPINQGAAGALFSLRRIPYLLVLALFVAFTQMWVNANKPPTAAQDEILNQYYEAEAGKNAFSQPTVQDEIMNLYYEAEARKNALNQLESAPTKAENSRVALTSSPSSPKQDLHLPQKRSRIDAVSYPLRPDAGPQVPRSTALRDQFPCRERGGRLHHHDDCRTR